MDPLASQNLLTPEELKQHALQPRDASGDGQRVANHSLQDLIALDKHMLNKQNGRPRFEKLVPPGAR